ncbi:hypothetical protein PR048_031046 [Dryococelus australis]|uniref:Uncharacterized protein n=1 Tax=Dryococelus australis TaxID=614101 RepID=A0ABQ9G465_9NEOP|nr:hypothetical protein PR048_031046 [Dryococelus australis]
MDCPDSLRRVFEFCTLVSHLDFNLARSQSSAGLVPGAPHSQSENGYACIKGSASPFRLCTCVLCVTRAPVVREPAPKVFGKLRLSSSLCVCCRWLANKETTWALDSWRLYFIHCKKITISYFILCSENKTLGKCVPLITLRKLGAAVAERLDYPPHKKANRVQSPAGPIPDFRLWESSRTMQLVSGFSRGSSVSSSLSFRRCSILTSVALIDSQDLAVKSRPIRSESPLYTTVGTAILLVSVSPLTALLLVHTTLDILTVLYNVHRWLVIIHWGRRDDYASSEITENTCKGSPACMVFLAGKGGSYKGSTGTRYKSSIASTRRALNWRAVFS